MVLRITPFLIARMHFAPGDYTRGFRPPTQWFRTHIAIAIADSLSLTVRVRRKTAPKVKGGKVQRKNRWQDNVSALHQRRYGHQAGVRVRDCYLAHRTGEQ